MKKTLLLASFYIFVFGCAHAFALTKLTIDSGAGLFSGQYMFTVTGDLKSNGKYNNANDRETQEMADAVFLGWVNTWFADNSINLPQGFSFDLYSKINEGSSSGDVNSGLMSVTYDDPNNPKTGGWSTIDPVQFYTVKGSGMFALYWLGVDGLSNGYWSTRHILTDSNNQPEISHLSAWNKAEGTTPVPEPSTLLLLGGGLVGLAYWRRRKS